VDSVGVVAEDMAAAGGERDGRVENSKGVKEVSRMEILCRFPAVFRAVGLLLL
jgi:hypothetical protein